MIIGNGLAPISQLGQLIGCHYQNHQLTRQMLRKSNCMQTFDEWMKENCNPADNYTFAQYGRYADGWRNSMPWSYRGMSISYDNWAQSRWGEIQNKEWLMLAWKEGLAICAKAYLQDIDTNWRGKTVEDAADFMLTIRGTFESLIGMGMTALAEQQLSAASGETK